MKTLIGLFDTYAHAQQAAALLVDETGLGEEQVQLVTQDVAGRAEEYFDDVPGRMQEEESMALGAGGGAMVAATVEEGEEQAVRAALAHIGLVELVTYEGTVDLAADAEPTWLDYESSFLRHFEANYAPKGQPFGVYAPAYRFGYEMALGTDEGAWNGVAGTARQRWQEEQQGNWEQFAGAVRFAWETVVEGTESLEDALGDEPLQTTKRGRLYQQLHEEDPA